MQGLAPMAGTDIQSWHCGLEYNKWIPLSTSGLPPIRRYKHAAIISDDKLYVIGGARVGRYLSDFQVLDLKTLIWSTIKLKMEATDKDGPKLEGFPEISGHSMIKWKKRLLLVAGLTKSNSDKVAVRSIDLESCSCGVVETFGNIPVSRRGQSVTLFGSKLIMFGGEDWKGRPLNDVHVLDLKTMTWSAVKTKGTRPTPRFDHVAVLHDECYLCIFGGRSRTLSIADLHVLDLERMKWLQQQMRVYPINPRAGHAGVAVDGNWYIVGSKSGALDTLVINMSKLFVSVLTTVKERDPLASEGISISSATLGGENFLITFGGYNGKYFNEVFAMRIKPKDSAPALSNLALIKTEADTSLQDLANGINSAKDKKASESPLAVCTTNYSANKSKIREVGGSAYRETTKELHSVLVPQHPQNFQIEKSGKKIKYSPLQALLPPPGFSSPLASGPSMNIELTTVPQTQLAQIRLNAERLPIQTMATASNPSFNHNGNAGDTRARASKSLSNLDVNACTNLNGAQIIVHESNAEGGIKLNTEIMSDQHRWLCMKEYDVFFKDTSQMTVEQLGIHAKACEMIKQNWN